MKKTLIAMFALAGVAMADSDLTWTLYSNPASENQSSQNAYGLVFDLKAGTGMRKAVSNEEGADYSKVTSLTLQTIKLSTGAESVGCNFVLMGDLTCNPDTSGDTGTVLGFIKSDAVSVAFNTATLDFSAQGITLTPDSSYRLFFTTGDYSGSIGTQVDLADNTSFNVKSYTGATSGERTHLGFLGSGLGPGLGQSENPIVSMTLTSAPVVPEPATATLSLLALAGLASRRRRH